VFKPVNYILKNYDQELLFSKYTGIFPDTTKKYRSLFRMDRTPGCRFEWRSGVLYFIDNAGYNNRVYFDIVGVVEHLYRLNTAEAIALIESDNVPNAVIVDDGVKERSYPEIRFKYKPWPEDNYFKIRGFDLESENVYLVDDYWIYNNNMWKYNSIHNPKSTLTIAYYFPETKRTKLYFPFKSEYKWYANTTNEIFGESKLDYYLEKDNRLVIITKSQKDRLILDYHLNIAAIAPQNEYMALPDNIINKLKMFKRQLIIYDNDYTGQVCAAKLSDATGFSWKCLSIGKDIFDNISNLNYIKNEIYT